MAISAPQTKQLAIFALFFAGSGRRVGVRESLRLPRASRAFHSLRKRGMGAAPLHYRLRQGDAASRIASVTVEAGTNAPSSPPPASCARYLNQLAPSRRRPAPVRRDVAVREAVLEQLPVLLERTSSTTRRSGTARLEPAMWRAGAHLACDLRPCRTPSSRSTSLRWSLSSSSRRENRRQPAPAVRSAWTSPAAAGVDTTSGFQGRRGGVTARSGKNPAVFQQTARSAVVRRLPAGGRCWGRARAPRAHTERL